jgi:hypothetical protein
MCMNDWLTEYNSMLAIQPLVADIKMGRVHPSSVLYMIQQLPKEERLEMATVLEVLYDALRWVEASRLSE